jgi:hypothetical protein
MATTAVLIFVAKHLPFAAEWAASSIAKALAGEKLKSVLKDRGKMTAYRLALKQALADFSKGRPELAASLFDDHFIRHLMSDELAKFLTRDERPSPSKISEAYAAQFPGTYTGDVSADVKLFLDMVERRCAAQHSLQELLTHRQTDESLRILRRLEGGEAAVGPGIGKNLVEDAIDASKISEAFRAASADLLFWPQLLGNDVWIERPEFGQLMGRLDESPQGCTLVLGEAGSGKSALLARIAGECLQRGWQVLAIKADQLPEDLSTSDGLKLFLGLPGPTMNCLKLASSSHKTVLIVDQLDGLSELIDLKTHRLRTILRLMGEARSLESVYIIASCRIFDRSYDLRLSAVEAEEIALHLPDWSTVNSILEGRGINSGSWPESFRELLRVPQCLKLFLNHFSSPSERAVFESYQTMLEHLWTGRLFGEGSVPGSIELVEEIATDMAEREVMFVPLARYDNQRKALDYAVAAGVLQYDRNHRQVSFTHQTIFDFARARAFISKQHSLSQYVLARQTGLFVRPKLWSALHYLRAADFLTYQRELLALWLNADLRPHIRALLIDFMGMQEVPAGFEVRALRPVFADQYFGPMAFAAIAARSAWFDVVKTSVLKDAMHASTELAWSTVRVLASAWDFAEQEVRAALVDEWLTDPSKTFHIFQCLRSISSWNLDTVRLACSLIERHELTNSSVDDLASIASASAPELALNIVGAQIKKSVSAALASQRHFPELPADADLSEHVQARVRLERDDPLRQVVDRSGDWYQLPAVAEAAPKAFFEQVWPAVREAIETFASEHEARAATYKEDYLSSTMLEVGDERDGREFPLIDAVVISIRALARQDVEAFWALARANEGSDSMTVQRVFAIGMLEIADRCSTEILGFILADVRRFSLENFHESERETKKLLRAIWPFLGPEERLLLEQSIAAADVYSVDARELTAADRQNAALWNREFRLRLLLQLPKDELSQPTQELLNTELRRFPQLKDERREVLLMATNSPMSAQTMSKASEKTVQQFLSAHPDSTEWGDHFRRAAGSVEISREFAVFAKANVEKALAIINSLDPSTHQRPAAYAIREFEESELAKDRLFDLILALDQRGFDGDEFRSCCAAVLLKRIKHPEGLPDEIVALLERWLAACPIASSDTTTHEREGEQYRRESLLWGHGRVRFLPHGTFPILNVLYFGLLLRDPLPSSKLISALRSHLKRQDRLEVWDVMAGETLGKLRWCERSDAQSFVQELFDAYPALLNRHSGALQVANCLKWCAPQLTLSWMSSVLKGETSSARQMYGELLGLRLVLLGDEVETRSELDVLLATSQWTREQASVIAGLTYAAVNLWKDTQDRSTLSRILCRSMDSDAEEVAAAALDWFRVVGQLAWSAEVKAVLEAFVAGRSLSSSKTKPYILDRVSDLIDDAPELVYQISSRMLDIFKGEVGDLSTSTALESETLLSIALTLQRQDEPHRSRGLELFEALLRYNAYKARDVLMDIDRRPGFSSPAAHLRRRRRAKPVKRLDG